MNGVTSRSLEVLDLSDNPLVTNQAMDFNPTASFLSNSFGLIQCTACNLNPSSLCLHQGASKG